MRMFIDKYIQLMEDLDSMRGEPTSSKGEQITTQEAFDWLMVGADPDDGAWVSIDTGDVDEGRAKYIEDNVIYIDGDFGGKGMFFISDSTHDLYLTKDTNDEEIISAISHETSSETDEFGHEEDFEYDEGNENYIVRRIND